MRPIALPLAVLALLATPVTAQTLGGTVRSDAEGPMGGVLVSAQPAGGEAHCSHAGALTCAAPPPNAPCLPPPPPGSRWSAYNALPPLCDVHVEMPLP